jgi:hypothetical protein
MDDTQKTREQFIEELNMVHTELNVICTLTDSLPDHIYARDTQGHFTAANAAQARHMGMEDPAEIRIGDPGFVVTGDRYHENPH